VAVDYQSFMNRINTINGIGTDANNSAAQLHQRDMDLAEQARAAALKKQTDAAAAKSAAAQQAAYNKQQAALQAQLAAVQSKLQTAVTAAQNPVYSGVGSNVGTTVKPGTGKNTFDNFLNAIVGQESGGNYGVVGVPVRGDRAYGKYQVMGNNIPSWTRMATGKSYTPQQYLNSPALQDAVAKHFLSGYYNKYGPQGAAVAWYAGEGTAQRYVKNPSGFSGGQTGGPSISAYALSIMRKMGLR